MAELDPAVPGPTDQDPRTKQLLGEIESCKRVKRNMVPDWRDNIEYRRGKPFAEDSDIDRVAVNVDFPYTRAKQATTFSKLPDVIVQSKDESLKPLAAPFGKALNEEIDRAKFETAMFEIQPDIYNAAGIGAAIIVYESITEEVERPVRDPATLSMLEQIAVKTGLMTLETVKVPRTIDARFTCTRLNPEDLLWDTSFKGSDFNQAAWIGRTGKMRWEEAKRTFPKSITDEIKKKVVSDGRTADRELNVADPDPSYDTAAEFVTFDEIYYWRHLYHADEKSYKSIQRVVFVVGLDAPVLDEPWKGQRADPNAPGGYIGSCHFPIQVCTVTYISNDAIPPSHSAISRPQVDEMARSRSQMVEQRNYSKPMRWFDDLRVDAEIRDSLMRGDWQGMIPVQGPGTNVIGEVARATYPQEDFAFNKIQSDDLQRQWGLGDNQVGDFASGERSASEASIVDQANQTQAGQDRQRFVDFFLRCVTVLSGLMSLYSPRVPEALRGRVNTDYAFSVIPDSMILVSAQARIQQLTSLLNYTAKMPGADTTDIMKEIVALHNVDPDRVVKPAPPPRPEPPNIGYSLRGEDIATNPIALAVMIRSGQAPTPEELQAAIQMQMAAGKAVINAAVQAHEAVKPLDPDGAAGMPVQPVLSSPNLPTSNEPQASYDPNPEWQAADRLDKRRES